MKLFKRNRYPAHLEDDLSLGKQILIFGWEIFKVVTISLAIIIPVRYFLIQPFYVKGASMEPNFSDFEYLIINEISYRFNEPQRGDVVVFRYPRDPSQFFIKRVSGLPQEQVVIRDGQVSIKPSASQDLVALDESAYLSAATKTDRQIDVTLGPDEYYLLGDNRAASLDSRAFGPVTRQSIIGKTLLRGWPIDKVGLFKSIDYGL